MENARKNIILSTIKWPIIIIVILLALIFFSAIELPLPPRYAYIVDKTISVFIISIVAWSMLKIVDVSERLILLKYNDQAKNKLLSQKTQTQIIILRRILKSIILVIAASSILLLFENVKNLGTSILASAGIVAIVAGIALQKPLNSLMTGVQMAIHQPIKINDYVILENEFGQIEEINLYYVVVKVWDLRRYIVPVNYFFDKPFQNLSRTSKEILGTIFLYVDYSLPVEPLRQELVRIVSASRFWDKKVCVLHVSDAKEYSIELRILISGRDPTELWDFRCEVREKLIKFIQDNYANSLPHARVNMVFGANQ